MILADYDYDTSEHRVRQAQLAQARRMRGLRPPRNARFADTTTGHYYAAKYLRTRGWTIEAALFVLCGPAACHRYSYRYLEG